MSNLSLRIQFTPTDVIRVHEEGQKVTIVKEVRGASGSKTAWSTFSPFQFNTVRWETEYGVYASDTEVQEGNIISILSAVNPAQGNVRYPFENGSFRAPETSVRNESEGELTFGLAQTVKANDTLPTLNPVNAVSVRTQQTAQFISTEKVKVFLSAEVDDGAVLSSVPDEALTVDLTGEPNQEIHYDGTEKRFVLGPLP